MSSKDGVSLTCMAHPGSPVITDEERKFIEEGGWRCSEGHPYCKEVHGPTDLDPLSPESLERVEIEVTGNPSNKGILE